MEVAWDEGREEQIECADPEAKGRERSWIWSWKPCVTLLLKLNVRTENGHKDFGEERRWKHDWIVLRCIQGWETGDNSYIPI